MNETAAPGPLVGKRILVTRAREQASSLSRLLAERGAIPIELPTITCMPPTDDGPLEAAIARLGEYDWAIFTSVNGVRFFASRLQTRGIDRTALAKLRLAAIGSATAATLGELGLRVDVVPDRFVAEELVDALRELDLAGKRVLLPVAQETRDVLAQGLSHLGASVDVVAVYQTVRADESPAAKRLLAANDLAAITLTSSSTVRNLVELVGVDGPRPWPTIATIGPITSQTARELGLDVQVEATEHTISGLVAALERHFER